MGLFSRRRPNVDKLRSSGDLEGLRRALRHEEPFTDAAGEEWDAGVPVRVNAAEALSAFYGPTVIDALSEAMGDPYPAVRLAAVSGLRRIKSPSASQRLLEVFVRWDDPPDGEARAIALQALTDLRLEGLPNALAGKLLEPGAHAAERRHEEALDLFLDRDPRGSGAAASVVADLLDELRAERDGTDEALEMRILSWVAPRALPTLLEALARPDCPPAVAHAAGAAGDTRALTPLIALLADAEPARRSAAASALGRLRDTRAVAALIARTQDEDQGVRDAASQALNAIGLAAVIIGVAVALQGDGALLGASEPAELSEAGPPASGPAPGSRLAAGDVEVPDWQGEIVQRLLREGE